MRRFSDEYWVLILELTRYLDGWDDKKRALTTTTLELNTLLRLVINHLSIFTVFGALELIDGLIMS